MMFFSPNPGILAAGVSTGKTTADWNAHITTLATSGDQPWGADVARAGGAYRTTAAAAAGTMYGTSWSSYLFYQFAPCRLIQHGLPNVAAFNDQVANGRQVFFRVASAVDQSVFGSLTRNGYTSTFLDAGAPSTTLICTEIIRWDGAKAWKSNPSIGGAETEYTW